MSALAQLLPIFPQLAHQVTPPAKASNIRLIPPPPTGTQAIKHGALQHPDAGPPGGDALPRRVVALLGPGASINGLAAMLKPIFDRAVGIPAGVSPLTRDELADGLVTYVTPVLPPGPERRQAGLLLPLPIEVGAGGVWTVNLPAVRSWLGPHFLPDWFSSRGHLARALPIPEPAQVEGEANALLVAPDAPAVLWDRALRNPSEIVLTFLAVVRLRRQASPADALRFVLAFLVRAKEHHVKLLALTTPGNVILRLCRTSLAGPRPADVDAAKLDAAKALVEGALFTGAPGTSNAVQHQDVPVTDDLVGELPGNALPRPGDAADPTGGVHAFVLGRDVAVGRPTFGGTAPVSLGPSFDGRLLLDLVISDDIGTLNPTRDPALEARLALLGANGLPPGTRIDAVSCQSPDVLTAGLGAWAMNDPTQLPALLFELQDTAPDDYDLLFGIHGLDVDRDPDDPARFRLRRSTNGGPQSLPLPPDQVPDFFGATTGTDGLVRFSPEWAARLRFASLVSRAWRRVQIRRALTQLRLDPVELAIASVSPLPAPYDLPFDTGGPSSFMQALVDGTVATPATPGTPVEAGPVASGLPGTTPARQTLAGFVIDLTDAAAPPAPPTPLPFAGFNPDETFYIGSTGKSVALYAALELRTRLRLAVAAAGDAGFDFRTANWGVAFAALVRKLWAARVARGFPPDLDVKMPARFPKLDRMFQFTTVAASPARATMAGKIDFLPAFNSAADIMVRLSDAGGASQVINAVGFPYLNGALREAGFQDPVTRQGLWISGNYLGTDWKPRTEPEPGVLSPRGRKHYAATTNFMGTPRQLARLFALAATGGLFGDATVSAEMVAFLRKNGRADVTRSFIQESIAARSPLKWASKLGIGDASPDNGRSGASDVAIIERRLAPSGITLRYVAVFVGGNLNDAPTYQRFVQRLDDAAAEIH